MLNKCLFVSLYNALKEIFLVLGSWQKRKCLKKDFQIYIKYFALTDRLNGETKANELLGKSYEITLLSVGL